MAMTDQVALLRETSLASLRSGINMVKVTTNVAFPLCRALHVGTAGTATITTGTGATATDFPLVVGLNPYEATKIVFGTASDIWAVY